MDFRAPFYHLLDMLYPNVCAVCHQSLVKGEVGICLHCIGELPRTYFGFQKHNPVERLFWGRVPIAFAGSFLYFFQHGVTQEILHRIKYQGDQELAEFMGALYAMELKAQEPDFQADCIIPVPLHPRKLRQRGYNQSLAIARGMSKILEVDIKSEILRRNTYSATQTKRNRFNRWMNVDGIFDLKGAHALENKKVILLDDVITTGATLEACIQALSKVQPASIGILSIAVAKN